MFDLRYHVASLAAVFVALLIGILVGVGMSGKVDDAEKTALKARLDEREARLEAAGEGRANLVREHKAFRGFVKNAYPLLIADRLTGKRIAILFVGPVDTALRRDVERSVRDAGASAPVRVRALKVPIGTAKVDRALDGNPALAQYRGATGLDGLGRKLADELVAGGDTPGWDALSSQLVEERAGTFKRAADGVVVARTVKPQQADTARFLAGLYGGLAERAIPAVGVETSSVSESAIPAWDRAGLSTVDDIETPVGRLALALLLSGSPIGNYGLKEAAGDGIVPPIEPLPTPPGG